MIFRTFSSLAVDGEKRKQLSNVELIHLNKKKIRVDYAISTYLW